MAVLVSVVMSIPLLLVLVSVLVSVLVIVIVVLVVHMSLWAFLWPMVWSLFCASVERPTPTRRVNPTRCSADSEKPSPRPIAMIPFRSSV